VRHKHFFFALGLVLLVAACRAAAPTPAPTPIPEANLTGVPTPIPNPTATPVPSPTVLVIVVEPTMTPVPGDERVSVRELPLGEPGHYANIVNGYRVQYPVDWHTGFGNRPLLVSFSNLDPGAHNRDSMRADGCLIEIRLSTNVFGMTLEEVRAQMPRVFADAEALSLDGAPALLVREDSEQTPFESEWALVEHADHWFRLSFDHAKGAGDVCRPAWESLLGTWQWFEPDFAVYRNRDYGYAISHPRRWYRFNPRQQGVSIASEDPTGMQDRSRFSMAAMLVDTDVFANEEGLSLKEWLAAQDGEVSLSNDIPSEGLVGVRTLRKGSVPEVQEMSGYYQGPLGKIYAVTCLYPVDQQWDFRPIANAIIYSFSF
jgi:hypothetical protein